MANQAMSDLYWNLIFLFHYFDRLKNCPVKRTLDIHEDIKYLQKDINGLKAQYDRILKLLKNNQNKSILDEECSEAKINSGEIHDKIWALISIVILSQSSNEANQLRNLDKYFGIVIPNYRSSKFMLINISAEIVIQLFFTSLFSTGFLFCAPLILTVEDSKMFVTLYPQELKAVMIWAVLAVTAHSSAAFIALSFFEVSKNGTTYKGEYSLKVGKVGSFALGYLFGFLIFCAYSLYEVYPLDYLFMWAILPALTAWASYNICELANKLEPMCSAQEFVKKTGRRVLSNTFLLGGTSILISICVLAAMIQRGDTSMQSIEKELIVVGTWVAYVCLLISMISYMVSKSVLKGICAFLRLRKRSHQRFDLIEDLEIFSGSQGVKEPIEAKTLDLSEFGARVRVVSRESKEELTEAGSDCKISFQKAPAKLDCKIVWKKDRRLGLRIKNGEKILSGLITSKYFAFSH